MTIWTSKSGAAALALTALAACVGGQGMGLIGSLGNITAKPNAEALTQATMAFGAVTLVPPRGYCIDADSLKQRFALMARCDQLGADRGNDGAPVGVITVSVTPARGDARLPTMAETADAFALKDVSDPKTASGSVVFRANGAPFSAQVSPDHWRGSAIIKGQMLGLALFGPPSGAAISSEGRALLAELIKRTQENSS